MRVDKIRTLAGPNVYSYHPVLVMRLELEELTEIVSTEIEGFIERLLAQLPGLNEHRCSRGHRGGFCERLREGTYFAHIVEHVALELSEPVGIGVGFGRARYAGREGLYNVIVEYKAEHAMRFLLQVAVDLVDALVRDQHYPLEEKLKEARHLVGRMELGPSTRAIVQAAERRGIPWFRIGDGSLVQLGYGKNRRLIQAAACDGTSAVGMEVASDKELTKILLDQASIPVPRGIVVRTWDEAVDAMQRIGGAVVVKPLDGRQGQGVSLNLTTTEEVAHAFHLAQEFSEEVIVEELFVGKNYRVLVVGGRMVAASERRPASVVGNGLSTVAELIEVENRNPLRGEGHEKPLTRIEIDEIVLAFLKKKGFDLDYVPRAGETVELRDGINLSTGGTATDVTDEVHTEVARMCERAARVIGMDICGVDLVLKDISAPLKKGSGGVIEINASPGLRMHHYPSAGTARDVASSIVEMLYPQDASGRIPLITITGTNGKTTVTRMIGHAIQEAGARVGMTTTDGIYIGGECIVEGDTTGPHSARTVLSDPAVEVAVLETARGGIVRRGLGYDWSDVAVMTNIQPDHLGQDGIESVDDLVHIKSLVAERVREGGTLVLNADDERVLRLADDERVKQVKKRIVYFSLRENHLHIKRHLDAGGTAYFVRNGWLVEADAEGEHAIVSASAIPATFGGTAEFNVANALPSAAACRAYGLAREQVAAALVSFRSVEQNPGRTNLYRVATGGYVLLDYGHNPEAFKSICRMAAAWNGGRRVTGIIGVPGDRSDELIEEAGRVAARGFNRVVIKEDEDLRGRRSGEVAEILRRTVLDEVPERECRVQLSDCDAVAHEMLSLKDGDVLVIFYDKLEPITDVLKPYKPVPVSSVEEVHLKFSRAKA